MLDDSVISSNPEQYSIKLIFAVRSIGAESLFYFIGFASTELSFCCYTNNDFFAPKRAIQEDLVVNTQGLEENKSFHFNETFQLINSREKISWE